MQTGETTIRASHSLVHWHGHPCKGLFGPARESQGRPGPAHHGRDGRATHGRDARATGFTLTEIMIAMGVLVVGMGMVAGALHAGIQVHIRTIDDIMRQLIGDNSLAMVQARVRHTTGASNGIPPDKYLLLGSTYFGPGDLKYPWNVSIPNGQPGYGAAVFMKRRTIDATTFANDYDVLIVPYTVTPQTTAANAGGTTVSAPTPQTNYTVSSDGLSVTGTGVAANLSLPGTVVFDNRDGSISTVKSVVSGTATMTDKLKAGAGTNNVTLTTLVLYLSGTTTLDTTCRLECSKPVQTKTALSPAPGWTPGGN